MIKLKLTNGAGLEIEMALPEENLWIEVVDGGGSTRPVGSLYVEEIGGGSVRTTLGRFSEEEGAWDIENEITV